MIEEVLPEKPPPVSVTEMLHFLALRHQRLRFIGFDLEKTLASGVPTKNEMADQIDALRSDLGLCSTRLRELSDAEKP